jgi:hypothetical protein
VVGFIVEPSTLLLSVAKVLTVKFEGRVRDEGRVREERRVRQEGRLMEERTVM